MLNIDSNKAERVSSGIPHNKVTLVYPGFPGKRKGTETRNRKDTEKQVARQGATNTLLSPGRVRVYFEFFLMRPTRTC